MVLPSRIPALTRLNVIARSRANGCGFAFPKKSGRLALEPARQDQTLQN
jgi:hypothetical protein